MLTALTLAACASLAYAQTYPAKSVRLLVGAPPGKTSGAKVE